MNYPENMTLQATVELPGNVENEKASLRAKFEWPGRIALLLAIIISPWLYGSVYFSAQSGIALALLFGLAFWWFETAVSEKKTTVFPYLFLPVGLGVLIVMTQSWGLPAWIGDSIMGKQIDYYKNFSGFADQWPSISLNRDATWSRFGQLILAVSGLCLGCRYFRTSAHMKLLMATCTINGAAISFFGIVQALTTTEPNRIFWVVELLYGGGPFGPYVNRNSAAGYLLICLGCSLGLITMLMAKEKKGPKALGTKDLPFWQQFKLLFLKFIAELDAKKVSCLLAAMLIAVGVIASLSRGGVLSLLVAATVTLFAFGMARKPDFTGFIFLPVVLLAVLLAGWLGFSDKLLERVDSTKLNDISTMDVRVQHWIDTWPSVGDFGPLGAGAGSYAGVHRPYRTTNENSIFIYGENQYFQTLVELGWPGLILLLTGWLFVAYYAFFALFRGNSAPSIAAGTAGVFVVTSQAVASFFDFGLYMPANMLLMSVVAGFLAYHSQSLAGRLRERTWLRFEFPQLFVQVVLLVMFAGVFVFMLDFYSKARIQSAVREYPISKFSYDAPNLSETERLIQEIVPLVESTRLNEGLNYVARLFEHRCRLQQLEKVVLEIDKRGLPETERAEVLKNVWIRTSLDFIQEQEFYLRRDKSPFQARNYRNSRFIKDNLPIAAKFLAESRKQAPMQPFVQVRLGQINTIIGLREDASRDMENATKLAPMNGNLRKLVGLYYLQADQPQAAAPHLRKYLEFDRTGFRRVMDIIYGRSGRRLAPMDDKLIFEQIVPDDAEMLFTLATGYFTDDSPYRARALDKAEQLLGKISASDRKLVLLNAKVKLAKGDIDGAIDQFEAALVSKPSDYPTHFVVAKLYYKVGDLERAREKLAYIVRMDGSSRRKTYRAFLTKVEAEIREARESAKEN